MQLTAEDMERLAGEALTGLPEPFRGLATAVAVQVVEWPDAEMLRDLGIAEPLELTGLYDGVPLTEKSSFDQAFAPDVVWLFRQPILAELRERPEETPERLIRHIMVHELAHHFGWSDDDIAAVDRWWE